MNRYEYVILNSQSWATAIGANCRDIARTLAQESRVLFVDPALDWASKLKGNYNAALHRNGLQQYGGNRLVEVEPNLWVYYPRVTLTSINWLPDNGLYDWFNRRNNSLLARDIQEALCQLGMTKYVLINDNEMFRGLYMKEILSPCLSIYYIRDNMLAVDYWRRHGKRLEPALIQKSDLVITNSAYLTSLAAQYNSNAVDVGQGCDLSHFVANSQRTEPADLASIPHPRIGYTGALTAKRLDILLLESVAQQRPDWQLVLIGPEDEAFLSSRLHHLPNVHFLGEKPFNQLPDYIQYLTVTINPQQVNPVTIGNYPRKIDEYLAMGKPVVAVKTLAMDMFKGHVLLAETATEFVSKIEMALQNSLPSTTEDRIEFAKGHSWINCIQAIKQAIKTTLHSLRTGQGTGNLTADYLTNQ